MSEGKLLNRLCFVLIDGLADVSYAQPASENGEVDFKTPLESSDLPNLDRLTSMSLCGLLDPVRPGVACGSDTAHLSIFGYPPEKYYRGRGAFESMGAGIDMQVGDIAFKSNFAVVRDRASECCLRCGVTPFVTSRRADRHFQPYGPPLCAYLSEKCADLGVFEPKFRGYSVLVQYSTEHRCGVRVRGPGLSDAISGTDPLRDNLPLVMCAPTVPADDPQYNAALFTCDLVNALSDIFSTLLECHPLNLQRIENSLPPANCVLLRGAGVRIQTPPFRFLRESPFVQVMIAPTACIKGLGLCLGLPVIVPSGTTGDYDSNLMMKGRAAIQLFHHRTVSSAPSVYLPSAEETDMLSPISGPVDFVFLHVKCVDDAGHDGSVEIKSRMLKKCDDVVGLLMRDLPADVALCVTGDHSTPCSFEDHSHEPVPFIIGRCTAASRWKTTDPCTKFDEKSLAQGVLGRFTGDEVMPLLRRICSATGDPSDSANIHQ
eukprot:ANDGO_01837.mRNA.1 2